MKEQQMQFEMWLKSNTSLSDVSVKKYSGAIKNISEWLKINIFEISTRHEILNLENKCKTNPLFIENNITGNNMYGAAINHYKKFFTATQAKSEHKLSFKDFALRVLEDSQEPMTYMEIWEYGKQREWDKELNSVGETPWQTLHPPLMKLVGSNLVDKIGTKFNYVST